jgi:outer membrane autotransporter protein
VTNIATATGTPAFGQLADVTATATITFVALPTGSITIVKTATGGDDTFGFTSTVAGATTFDLATAGGTASRNFANLTPATYTFTEVNLPANWSLTTLSCTGNTGGTPTTVDLANRTASVGLDDGEAITCTFGNTLAADVPNPIRPFLTHRLTFLADGPDRHRIFRRIPGSFWGDTNGGGSTGGGGPFAFVGSSDDNGGMQMSVATSLLDLSKTYAQANGTLEQLPTPSVDVWLEVHYSEFEDEDSSGARSDGHFGVAYVGIDYLVTPTVLIGLLGQVDWGEEDSNLGSSIDGIGGMAGPYLSARLTPNLFFTTRAAYGISENEVSPIGTYTDDFSTDRWLASAELTGNWNFGNFRFTPTASVTYLQEDQHGYTDSLGTPIPSQTVSLGQLSFGPELAYRFVGDRFNWEPHVSVNGLWDFDDDDGIVSGLVATDDDLRARVKAGILAQAAGGASFRIVGTFDGIGGDGFDAFGGQAWLNIPLR